MAASRQNEIDLTGVPACIRRAPCEREPAWWINDQIFTGVVEANVIANHGHSELATDPQVDFDLGMSDRR
ncbi:MAG: hypothetical protein WAL84_05655 [Candidatus Dormiibacterota bacterium]